MFHNLNKDIEKPLSSAKRYIFPFNIAKFEGVALSENKIVTFDIVTVYETRLSTCIDL